MCACSAFGHLLLWAALPGKANRHFSKIKRVVAAEAAAGRTPAGLQHGAAPPAASAHEPALVSVDDMEESFVDDAPAAHHGDPTCCRSGRVLDHAASGQPC